MHNRREFLKNILTTSGGIVFTSCGLLKAARAMQQTATAPKRREVSIGGRRVHTFDVHSHVQVPEVWELIKDKGVPNPFNTPLTSKEDVASVEARLALMDEQGIDVQAVSINPFWYGMERDLAREVNRVQNQRIAEMCAAHPDRFVGLCTVALQHPELAAEQLEEGVKKLGMRGCLLHATVLGEELSARKLDPFWAKAEELGCLVFIHPAGFRRDESRFRGNGTLGNVIGNPLDTTVALTHLIFDGTLDRFPGVKICGAHGGGFLPSNIARADHCVEFTGNWPADCKPVKKMPSEYLKQLYFDTVVYTPEALRHLIAQAGASQVVLGTDMPAGMSDPDAVNHILKTPGLSDADRVAILSGNGAKLLRVTGP